MGVVLFTVRVYAFAMRIPDSLGPRGLIAVVLLSGVACGSRPAVPAEPPQSLEATVRGQVEALGPHELVGDIQKLVIDGSLKVSANLELNRCYQLSVAADPRTVDEVHMYVDGPNGWRAALKYCKSPQCMVSLCVNGLEQALPGLYEIELKADGTGHVFLGVFVNVEPLKPVAHPSQSKGQAQ
jgi:hypothetical protein